MKTLTDYTGPFPVIELAGTDFLVNACTMQLIQADDPSNKIDYFDMIDLQDHLELVYDTSTKSSFQGRWDQYHDKENTELFWLRPFGAMDPKGMNELMDHIKPGWRSTYLSDWPVISLAGKEFFADDQLSSFRQKDNPWNRIHFHDVVEVGGKSGVYIDTRVLNVPFPHQLDIYQPHADLPEHVIFAAVPSGPELAVMLNGARTEPDLYSISPQRNVR